MALNLICVDEASRKAIDIPIRPRPAKNLLLNEVCKSKNTSNALIKSEIEHKTNLDSKELNSKAGMCVKWISFFYA